MLILLILSNKLLRSGLFSVRNQKRYETNGSNHANCNPDSYLG